MSTQRSFRLSDRTMRLLDERAGELSVSRNALVERLLDEGLHTDRHPLIQFRGGAGGAREPALVGTRLYVTHVLETLRGSNNSVEEAADYLGLTEREIRAVVDYYADFPGEVDAQLEEKHEFERREYERWERAQRVLA